MAPPPASLPVRNPRSRPASRPKAAPTPTGPGSGSTSLDKADAGEEWPLIRYLLDQSAYMDRYLGYLREAVDGPFAAGPLVARYETLAAIIQPHVPEAERSVFRTAIGSLAETTRTRNEAVRAFLSTR